MVPEHEEVRIPVYHRRPEVRLERVRIEQERPPIRMLPDNVQILNNNNAQDQRIGLDELRRLLTRVGMRCKSPRTREERQPPLEAPQRPRNRAARKRIEYFKQQRL